MQNEFFDWYASIEDRFEVDILMLLMRRMMMTMMRRMRTMMKKKRTMMMRMKTMRRRRKTRRLGIDNGRG